MDKLLAGRELDALIAEKVMGWVKVAYLCTQSLPGCSLKRWVWTLFAPRKAAMMLESPYYRLVIGDDQPMTAEEWRNDTPFYSFSMGDAWQVVEKCNLLVSPTPALPGGRQWMAGRFKGVTASGKRYCFDETIVQATTAPLAICRAALKVMQIQHEHGFIIRA